MSSCTRVVGRRRHHACAVASRQHQQGAGSQQDPSAHLRNEAHDPLVPLQTVGPTVDQHSAGHFAIGLRLAGECGQKARFARACTRREGTAALSTCRQACCGHVATHSARAAATAAAPEGPMMAVTWLARSAPVTPCSTVLPPRACRRRPNPRNSTPSSRLAAPAAWQGRDARGSMRSVCSYKTARCTEQPVGAPLTHASMHAAERAGQQGLAVLRQQAAVQVTRSHILFVLVPTGQAGAQPNADLCHSLAGRAIGWHDVKAGGLLPVAAAASGRVQQKLVPVSVCTVAGALPCSPHLACPAAGAAQQGAATPAQHAEQPAPLLLVAAAARRLAARMPWHPAGAVRRESHHCDCWCGPPSDPQPLLAPKALQQLVVLVGYQPGQPQQAKQQRVQRDACGVGGGGGGTVSAWVGIGGACQQAPNPLGAAPTC